MNVVVRHQQQPLSVLWVQILQGLLDRARDGRVHVGEADGPNPRVLPGVRPGRLEGALARAVDVVAAGLLRQDDDVAPHLALLEEIDELSLPLQPRVLPLLGGTLTNDIGTQGKGVSQKADD